MSYFPDFHKWFGYSRGIYVDNMVKIIMCYGKVAPLGILTVFRILAEIHNLGTSDVPINWASNLSGMTKAS